MNSEIIKEKIKNLKGKVGFCYKDLESGYSFGVNEDDPFIAASIIKIPVLIEAYRKFKEEDLSKNELVEIRESDRVPSCGAAAYIHPGAKLTLKDLCILMIILSDNMAANILINKLKMDDINSTMKKLSLKKTRVNRILFDSDAQKSGKENYFAPGEILRLFEMMWNGSLISPDDSRDMLEIFKLQQINYKMPYLLPEDICIAHKTGDDDGITHDAGIVYAKRPFILCFASNETDVNETDEFIRQTTEEIFRQQS
ncbi:MAG TPA: serine hydrolase [Clostridium sp.]|jgi:beta-lactamase class A|uniref:Serine hydrolase n=1 Tax=Clostridium lapidicellarium TaxID=3240931 RepID=A0ABV4DZG5_9CLOT|nr:serine hydrolase [Clostridiales bacterium]HBC96737.1 serine hydrolase [Clostridium sp.]